MSAGEKQALRQRMLQRRQNRPAQQQTRIDGAVFRQLVQLPVLINSKVIFLYCSVKKEISTYAYMDYALSCGKTVCVPRCGAAGTMEAHQIISRTDLRVGKFGIPEPDGRLPVIPPDQIEAVIAPCLCADAAGYRLGYGGGYYDRFLARAPHAAVVVLCPADCIVPTVFPQAHDIRCTQIVTESEVLVPYEK